MTYVVDIHGRPALSEKKQRRSGIGGGRWRRNERGIGRRGGKLWLGYKKINLKIKYYEKTIHIYWEQSKEHSKFSVGVIPGRVNKLEWNLWQLTFMNLNGRKPWGYNTFNLQDPYHISG